ncbi:hypothetical protein CAPTEDRAFT_188676 [Capitella teleta]|uniref:Uncharacterized protein n=1 Tax=Capitella teleta TaxID=283909 RepID=R7U8S7_CAPTE|nr:hypothetical protein CAPTEDRAFT_188676 [Capitella teleta]|eukprot:ELU00102.1 hypothetical protein CAPTEDRAFT_188676 [Capitella teleta]
MFMAGELMVSAGREFHAVMMRCRKAGGENCHIIELVEGLEKCSGAANCVPVSQACEWILGGSSKVDPSGSCEWILDVGFIEHKRNAGTWMVQVEHKIHESAYYITSGRRL